MSYDKFYGYLGACADSVYQALFSPPTRESLGTRLVDTLLQVGWLFATISQLTVFKLEMVVYQHARKLIYLPATLSLHMHPIINGS